MIGALAGLGVRLAAPRRYDAAARLTLLTLGLVVCTFVILCGLAAPGALDRQAERRADLALAFAADEDQAAHRLWALDTEPLSDRRWDGHRVTRVAVAERGMGAPEALPGVERLPAPDEVVLSPRLRELITDIPAVRALFSAYEPIGTISAAGLTQPHELRAVIGVSPTTDGLRPVSGVGVPESGDDRASTAALNTVVGAVIAVLVLVPAGGMVVLCSRLGSRQRRGRIHALRRLGLGRHAVRIVLATEIGVFALPAVVIGAVAYGIFAGTCDHVPFTTFGFSPGDLRLPFPRVGAAMLAVFALSVLAAAAGVRVDELGHATPTTRRGRGGRRVGYLVLAVGVLLFASFELLPYGAAKAVSLWVAYGLIAVGLAMSVNGIVVAVSRAAARRVADPGALVGLRVGAAEPGSTARMASVVAALVVCLSASFNLLTVLANSSQGDSTDDATGHITLTVLDFGGALTLDELREIPGVTGAVPVVFAKGDRDDLSTIVSSCAQLEALVGGPVSDCDGSPSWLVTTPASSAGAIHAESSHLRVGGNAWRLPGHADHLVLPHGAGALARHLLLPPGFVVEQASAIPTFVVRIPVADRSEVLARISSRSPSTGFDFGDNASLDTDSREYSTQISWLLAGAFVSLVLTLLALCIGVLGEAEARRNRLRGLYVLGARTRHLATSHIASVLVPLAVVAIVAGLATTLTSIGMSLVDERAQPSVAFLLSVSVGGLAVAVIATAVTLPSALRAWSPDETTAGD
ncbi:hypothetical protein KV100_11075 [Mumia sp. zg.B21]|uniref:ABC transporter permease n=1 Tax=Mumia sp. zg.B21 TaxID=2855447 RepID=UPI001C6E588F|nr:FtsX-like permease family protein [Mumia sp. zg.B21]MBW9210199.1 hypothetical protein [Mumia sp. zg.B21]